MPGGQRGEIRLRRAPGTAGPRQRQPAAGFIKEVAAWSPLRHLSSLPPGRPSTTDPDTIQTLKAPQTEARAGRPETRREQAHTGSMASGGEDSSNVTGRGSGPGQGAQAGGSLGTCCRGRGTQAACSQLPAASTSLVTTRSTSHGPLARAAERKSLSSASPPRAMGSRSFESKL